jgi:uncharacterized protein with FMN-binding domain
MRRVILAGVNTIVGLILLLSFKTHAVPTTLETRPAVIGDPTTSTTPTTRPATMPPPVGSVGSPPDASTASTRTVTGNAASTRYGPVMVQITVTNGQITAANAVEYPTAKARDIQINARAVPRLNQETLAAQSAHIDMVSGATYTSNGYITSLQSALDKAGLA